jgi:hypothetical protein
MRSLVLTTQRQSRERAVAFLAMSRLCLAMRRLFVAIRHPFVAILCLRLRLRLGVLIGFEMTQLTPVP